MRLPYFSWGCHICHEVAIFVMRLTYLSWGCHICHEIAIFVMRLPYLSWGWHICHICTILCFPVSQVDSSGAFCKISEYFRYYKYFLINQTFQTKGFLFVFLSQNKTVMNAIITKICQTPSICLQKKFTCFKKIHLLKQLIYMTKTGQWY